MDYIKKIWIIGTLFLLSFSNLNAQNAIKITEPNGDESIFMLSSKPGVSIEGDYLIVSSNNDITSFWFDNSIKFEFVNYNPESSIVKVTKSLNTFFKLVGNHLEAKGLSPNTPLRIYDISGKIIENCLSDSKGNVWISLNNFPKGLYIVNYNSLNFKFYKK